MFFIVQKSIKTCWHFIAILCVISIFTMSPSFALDDDARHEDESLVITGEESLSANYLAGRFAQNQRDYATAAIFFQRSLADDPKNAELLGRAFLLNFADGNIGETLQLAPRLLKVKPDHKLSILLMSMKALKEKHPNSALQILATMPTNKNDKKKIEPDITSNMLKAWILLSTGNKATQTKLALKQLEELKGPEWVDLYKTLHSALIVDMQNGASKAPNQFLEPLLAKLPIDFQALRLQEITIKLLMRENKYDAAQVRWNALPKAVQNHPSIQKLKQSIEEKAVLPAHATSSIEGAAEVFFDLGSILSHETNEDLAAIYLYTSVYLKPNFDIAWMALGEFYQDTKVPARAIESFRHIGKDSVFYQSARIDLADHLTSTGEDAEAELILKKLIEEFPESVEARAALGSFYRQSKKFELAQGEYTIAIEKLIANSKLDATLKEFNKEQIEPKYWSLFYYRGMSHERLRKFDLAEQDLKQALVLHENDPSLLNYLGYIWTGQGKNLPEAKVYIEKAVKMRPNNGYYLDSLAWINFKLGNLELALQNAQMAARLNPNDAVIIDHYADILWKSGFKVEAKFNWQHALSMKTDEAGLHDAIKKKLVNGI